VQQNTTTSSRVASPKSQQEIASSESDLVITDEEREKYVDMFKLQQPIDGFLEGERVKAFLMESGLPIETLGHIW
jgi:hypothetical protein